MSKAIDKAAGAEREVVGHHPLHRAGGHLQNGGENTRPWQAAALEAGHGGDITSPATPGAVRWQGWGTALKPGWEIIVVARKPLVSTVAANILQYGTGGLNIDACRIATAPGDYDHPGNDNRKQTSTAYGEFAREGRQAPPHTAGRWPANVVLDSDAAAELDQQSGEVRSSHHTVESVGAEGTVEIGPVGLKQGRATPGINTYSDHGGASRFYFTAKASTDERINHDGISHPTVKPLSLMRWLTKLVTQPGGVVLDPFAGSGTTVEACILEGFRCIAVEREADYLPLITQRINRRLDPVAYLEASGDDLGLFGEIA